MREILFRGRRLDNGEWVYGSFWPWPDGDCVIVVISDGRIRLFKVDPATVGQWTGRVDKNGTKIWEGDITTGLFLFGMSVNGAVTFRNGSFGLLWKRGNVDEFVAFTSTCNITFEVIGNVYDNPEMAEED